MDVVHDLNTYPYPFEENTFDHIEMSHVIEHVARPLHLVEGILEVLKDPVDRRGRVSRNIY